MIPFTISLIYLAISVLFVFAVGLIIWAMITLFSTKDARGWRENIKAGLILPSAISGGLLPLILFQIALNRVRVPLFYRIGIGVPLVIVVAAGLFALKLNHLRSYAVFEISFALVGCIQTLWTLSDTISLAQLLGLFAAAYLLIRGMDNFKKDLDQRRDIEKSVHNGKVAKAVGSR